MDAIVVLPEHLHCIWTLPRHDSDYPYRWRLIKTIFTRLLVKNGVIIPQNKNNEYQLWQRRYWEHTIRDDDDFRRHVDYIHYNPVKHGLVSQVSDWQYSSFHRYVINGIYPNDWGGGVNEVVKNNYGE